MKKQILMIGVLVGLNLIATAAKANGTTSNVGVTTTVLSINKETLSEVIQTLIKKDYVGASASSTASLTISILENYQNNQSAYLKATKAEQALFNETVRSIANQVVTSEKTSNWIKEINKSAKAINTIWAILEAEPKIESDLTIFSEQTQELVVVFQN